MKILVVEDEPIAAKRLMKMIDELSNGATNTLSQTDSIEATVNWWEKNPEPDLIFLDIHLADGNSFEIFKKIDIKTPIIFTTAYDQYALQAFKVNAVDYLLKPIKEKELAKALNKFKSQHNNTTVDYHSLAQLLSKEKRTTRFMIRLGHQIKVVELENVAFFYTQSKITFLIDKKGKRYPIDYSLEKLEELLGLPSPDFFRINRQFIISLASIQEMISYSKSRVKIILQPKCELETIVSTERSPHFKKWLGGNWQ